MAGNVRDILVNLLGKETISGAARRAADGVDDLGDSMQATASDAQRLDREVEQAEDALRSLAVQYARTQSAAERLDLTKAMRQQQAELRRATKARGLLPDFAASGAEAASGFGASFVTRIGPLLARAPVGPAGAAIGAALGLAAVPTLGAAVAGGVLGGVGVGGVIGGVKLAARDSRVKSAGAELGAALLGDLEDMAGRFVGPTIHGIGIIRGAWADVADDVDGVFAATSRYVEPLARGVADFARQIAPGLRQAAEAAGPIVREIGQGLPRVGRAIGDVLSEISGKSAEGASAMRGLFMFAEKSIRAVGGVITVLAALYRGMIEISTVAGNVADKWAGWVPVLGGAIDSSRENLAQLKGGLDESGEAGEEAGDGIFAGLMKAAEGASTAKGEVKSFTQALQELRDQNLSVIETEIQFEQALDETAAAAKRASGGLDKGTEAGRKNWGILTALVRDTKAYSAAVLERTGNEDAAAAVTEEGRKAFIKSAVQMGLSEKAAKDYANQLFGIPRKVSTDADFHPDNQGVKRWKQTLSGIPRNVFIKAHFDLINNSDVAMALRLGRLSKGGPVVGSGPKGVDSQPYLLAPGEHVLTAAEVDAAGGHAGVERMRAVLRGERSAAPAVGVAVAGGGSGGSTSVVAAMPPLVINAAGASGLERLFVAWLVRAIRDAGGDPRVLGLGGTW